MSPVYRKTLVHVRYVTASSASQQLRSLYTISPDSFSIPHLICTRKVSSLSSSEHSYAVSYLINSCGLSPQSALKASKHIKFETPRKPDSVIGLLRNHGLSQTQISNLIAKYPQLLLSDPDKTLLPKFEFFYSKGVSRLELAKILSSNPGLFSRSLENQIIPSYEFVSYLLQSDDEAIDFTKRFSWFLTANIQTYVVPNINLLRDIGVPESEIINLVRLQPRLFKATSARLKEVIVDVKNMGFVPSTKMFLIAFRALGAISKLTWQKKVNAYRRWGLSDEEIILAFQRCPWCVAASEAKISSMMDFLVNQMGFNSSIITKRPVIMSLSLERRIIPRCYVLRVLLSKKLIKERVSLSKFLEIPEQKFIRNFISCHLEEAPHLLELYLEKRNHAK